MRAIPAREIERCGLSALDAALKDGPVHVIQDGTLRYVVLSEAHYAELLADHDEAMLARVKESMADYAAGRVRRWTAPELIKTFGLDN